MSKFWGLLLTVLVSNTCIADTSMPSSATLLKNFDRMGVVEKGKWKNGESPDGVKILTFRDVGDIYSLNPDFASSVSLTKGEKNKDEFLHSEEVCKNLVYGVTGEKNQVISDTVTNIVYGAARSRDRSDSDSVKDYWIEAEFIHIGETPGLACKVSKLVKWD